MSVTMVDSLNQYYVGHCQKVYLIHTMFQKLTLLPLQATVIIMTDLLFLLFYFKISNDGSNLLKTLNVQGTAF
jgi:hypothetical protein